MIILKLQLVAFCAMMASIYKLTFRSQRIAYLHTDTKIFKNEMATFKPQGINDCIFTVTNLSLSQSTDNTLINLNQSFNNQHSKLYLCRFKSQQFLYEL